MKPGPILVTGGAGFIGSAIVRRLVLEEEQAVVNLDKLTYAGNKSSLGDALNHKSHYFHEVDIVDRRALREIFSTFRPSAVMHLAAESHVDRSIDGAADFVRTNLVGTYSLLEESLAYWQTLAGEEREGFRFLHVSTDEVFGALGADGAFHENTPYDPRSPYSATKAGSDHLVRAWHHTHGLPVVITNCSNNYGPYQYPEKLIPVVVLRAFSRQGIPVYGSGNNVRDWLHVDDHVEALLAVLRGGRPGETYVVGGRNERTNLEIVRGICRVLDDVAPAGKPHDRLIEYVTDRPGHDFRYAIDPSKIESELGWRPRVPFDSGLRAAVEWYLENRSWCAQVLDGRYDLERLGLSSTVTA